MLIALLIFQMPPQAGWLAEVMARSVPSLWLSGGLLVLVAHTGALWRLGWQ